MNRFKNAPFVEDKHIKAEGRGSCDQVRSADGKVILTKWFDTKIVSVGSNFVGIGKQDIVQKREKKSSNVVSIQRPESIQIYNASMNGVDVFDQQMAYYREDVKAKKWTIRVIFYFADMAVTCAHKEYLAQMAANGDGKVLDLHDFKRKVAISLIDSKTKRRKVERTEDEPPKKVHKRNSYEHLPSSDVRHDQLSHWPSVDEDKSSTRCKNAGCTFKTHIFCVKCNAHFCLVAGRNCFFEIHNSS